MNEIKIRIGKGGKTKINSPSPTDKIAKFTEKLAKELGTIEERHKGSTSTSTHTDTQEKLSNGG